jgi:hypothetical protein
LDATAGLLARGRFTVLATNLEKIGSPFSGGTFGWVDSGQQTPSQPSLDLEVILAVHARKSLAKSYG